MKIYWISAIAQRCSRLAIDRQLLISMFRNALPPTAALWLIQSSSLGKSFDVVGYLPIILCILQQPIQPRVQFVKAMLMTCILSALSACIALLAGFCSTKARLHTTPSGRSLSAYNSSAAAVSGIWLIVAVWAIQTFRVYRPQFTTSCVIATIMAIVSISIGANLSTTSETTHFVVEMLQMFFLSHAFCLCVNLFIFPTASRDVVFSDIRQYSSLLKRVFQSETFNVRNLAEVQQLKAGTDTDSNLIGQSHFSDLIGPQHNDTNTGRPQDLEHLMAELSKLHAKMRGDLKFAHYDIGWSTINSNDLESLVEFLRKLILSLRGMCALMPLFQSICDGGAVTALMNPNNDVTKTHEVSAYFDGRDEGELIEWRSIFRDLRHPVEQVNELMRQGLQFVEVVLGLGQDRSLLAMAFGGLKRDQNKPGDLEASGVNGQDTQVAIKYIENLVNEIHRNRGLNFQKWQARRQSKKSADEMAAMKQGPTGQYLIDDQEQLFVILFMQHLFHHISDVIFGLVKFADSKSLGSSAQKKSLTLPTSEHLAMFLHQLVGEDDTHEDFDHGMSQIIPTSARVSKDMTRTTSTFKISKLTTVLGLSIARISHVIGSHQSFFGFRVACAVMSVVIVGLLSQTQQWFYNHRALWAAVFIPFSMSPNSGETLALLGFRMIGSAFALGLAIINWYIVDGHPAGVIVFYFVFQMFEQYFSIRLPQYGSIWRPAMITRAIIMGYVLQTQASQTPSPPATTLSEYPVYLIGPYRYTCTAVGVFVAFIWTIFPRAVSARSLVRKKLGDSLSLLALYYNCMHSTVGMWAMNSHGDLDDPQSPRRQLRQVRDKLFAQELVTLEAIRGHMRFSRFEPSMGATFRRELYDEITKDVDTIVAYMNMIVYAAGTLSRPDTASEEKQPSTYWKDHLAQAFRTADFSTHSISVILSVLSVAVSNNQPLPPGLTTPQPYHLTKQIQMQDPDMLNPIHAEEPGYAAFAVIEIGAAMMYSSLGTLVDHVKDLVGVVEYVGIVEEKGQSGKQA